VIKRSGAPLPRTPEPARISGRFALRRSSRTSSICSGATKPPIVTEPAITGGTRCAVVTSIGSVIITGP
jgi:hypothetical protein